MEASGYVAERSLAYTKRLNPHTIVFIFSDGYDTAKPEELAIEVRKIKAHTKRVIWVNPLLGRRKGKRKHKIYPVEKSLQLALPHFDLYPSAHSLVSLQKLESALVQCC